MKRYILILTCVCFALGVKAQTTPIDTLAYEERDNERLEVVDSLVDEKMYMQALNLLDSMETQRKRFLGKEPTFMMFFTKCVIYMEMEEPSELVSTAEKCFSLYTGYVYESLLYSMQGNAYRQLGEYKKAIQAYESSISKSQFKDGKEGSEYCGIADCYLEMGKKAWQKFF